MQEWGALQVPIMGVLRAGQPVTTKEHPTLPLVARCPSGLFRLLVAIEPFPCLYVVFSTRLSGPRASSRPQAQLHAGPADLPPGALRPSRAPAIGQASAHHSGSRPPVHTLA